MADAKPSGLSAEVFSVLKQRIIRWQYPPGHRFTEEQLCDEFGVSRSPVREALRMLVENGLVEKVPHRGYSVKRTDIAEIRQYYDLRLALELHIGEWLAENGMPREDWLGLRETWSSILGRLPGVDVDVAQEDERFHEMLAAATGNRAISDLVRTVNERLRFVRMTDITTVERLKDTCLQHLQILDGIAARDTAGVRAAMRSNIEHGRKNVEAAFKEALARAYSEQKNP